MLNTPYIRNQFKQERQQDKVSTILFWFVSIILVTCFLAFAVRFTCLGIKAVYDNQHQTRGIK